MDTIYNDIKAAFLAERHYQDQKWGGPDHDDVHDPPEWVGFIREYAEGTNARTCRHPFQTRIVKCGALALAAVEREDREYKDSDQIDKLAIIEQATGTMTIADEITPKTSFATLSKNLIRHAGTGNEGPKVYRDSMLCVVAYCVRVLYMLRECGAWPASTAESTSSK